MCFMQAIKATYSTAFYAACLTTPKSVQEENVATKETTTETASKSFQFNEDRIDSTIKQLLKYAGSAKNEVNLKIN